MSVTVSFIVCPGCNLAQYVFWALSKLVHKPTFRILSSKWVWTVFGNRQISQNWLVFMKSRWNTSLCTPILTSVHISYAQKVKDHPWKTATYFNLIFSYFLLNFESELIWILSQEWYAYAMPVFTVHEIFVLLVTCHKKACHFSEIWLAFSRSGLAAQSSNMKNTLCTCKGYPLSVNWSHLLGFKVKHSCTAQCVLTMPPRRKLNDFDRGRAIGWLQDGISKVKLPEGYKYPIQS